MFTTYLSRPSDPGAARATYVKMMATPSHDTGFRPTATPPADDRTACPPTRCHDYRVPLPAGVRVSSSMVRVLLPPGYATSHRRYPVVYLFNGGATDYRGWSRQSQLTSISRDLPAIFVMPDGGQGAQLGMFSDWLDGSYQWETFHTEVLPRWVDRHFRTAPGRRAAVGQSLAALGAIGYAARHPGLFQAVLSLSGMVETRLLSPNVVPPRVSALTGTDRIDLTRVWGDPVTRADVWAAHDPSDLARQLHGVRLYLSSGTGYLAGPDTTERAGRGYLEHLLWQGHRTFLGALTREGVPFRARIARGDVHEWPWFDRPLRWGLARILAPWGAGASTSSRGAPLR